MSCLNVREIGKEVTPGVFELDEDFLRAHPSLFEDDVDFWDEAKNWPIWSIGKRKIDGKVFASVHATAIFYQHEDYDCVWLR